MARLTARQLQCLRWAEEGKSARDIGTILGISARTVEEHIAIACAALGVRTRVQAVVFARRLGLLKD
jgi:DNA-binding CsgD family transcriptional regulator